MIENVRNKRMLETQYDCEYKQKIKENKILVSSIRAVFAGRKCLLQ